MTKKFSSCTSNQPLAAKDMELITIKLISAKGDKKHQFKNLEKVEVDSPMSNNLDASPLVPTDKQNIVLSGENNSLKTVSATSKRIHKHKHKHPHCRHHHHHHHHNHRVTKTTQQQKIVYREASKKNSQPKTSAITPDGTNNQPKTSASIPDRTNNQPTSVVDQEKKSTKGNIPLQSIENKIVSQRATSTDETQVGNCSSIFYTQPTSSCACTECPQQIEQIVLTEDCCVPQQNINCCVPQQTINCCVPQQTINCCSSCILQQSETICCLPQQQQQQQLFLCTDATPSPQYLCVPQQSGSIIIQQQQPSMQAQPIQIIQAPQAQPAQYLQITSATPQIIQTVQAPAVQAQQLIQIPAQAMAVSPQILYQRPYDSLVMPVQNQQFAIAQAPVMALSQPSYAPTRVLPGLQARPNQPGPRMFQQALIRTIAGRAGVPLPPATLAGLPQLAQPAPFYTPTRGAALASTGRALINDGVQPSTSSPIVPLTAGGLLIPFQPSNPATGSLPRSNLRNFDRIQQQIQHRAQLLAEIQRQNAQRTPSLPIHSPNRVNPPSLFSRNLPRSGPGLTSNVLGSSPLFSSSIPKSSSFISPNIPQPPPIIRSQTPYTPGNAFGTSSSSSSTSSRSSASSILPRPNTQAVSSNPFYSGPSSTNLRGDSVISGPSAPYQSLRP